MAPRALIGIALAAALVGACDPLPPRPETSSTATAQSPAAGAGAERSIRLFGPGIARQRQIRV